jgi:hypothetical protein
MDLDTFRLLNVLVEVEYDIGGIWTRTRLSLLPYGREVVRYR